MKLILDNKKEERLTFISIYLLYCRQNQLLIILEAILILSLQR